MFNPFFKNKLSYKINKNSKIVYLQFIGEVSSGNIINMNKQVINTPEFDNSFNWIIDIRRSKQLFAPKRMNKLLGFFKNNAEMFQNIKMVFIISSPKQSITMDSLANLLKKININISIKKVFNENLAYSWVIS